VSEESLSPTDKTKKKIFSQPTFTEEKLKKSADEIRRRWKYDEVSQGPEFDEWAAAFTIGPTDLKTRDLFREFNLNDRSPYHWRALLEAFIREHVTYRGRPDEKTPEKFFRFALDVVQIIRDHSKDGRNYSSLANALQKFEPYRSRYKETNPDTLRKSVKEVTDLIGPMDGDPEVRLAKLDPDDALVRLAKLDPDRFLDAFVERAGTTEEDLRRWD
jgi:hypothetical protein